MSLQHLNFKLFVEGDLAIDLEDVIKLFHRWVADQSTGELLIDVADYRHVPDGPSVVLVGHEAHYAFDCARGRYGLLYNRRTVQEGTDEQKIAQAFHAAAAACTRLENSFSTLKFKRDEFEVTVNDRALATVESEGQADLKAATESFVRSMGNAIESTEFEADQRCRVRALVKLSQPFEWTSVPTA